MHVRQAIYRLPANPTSQAPSLSLSNRSLQPETLARLPLAHRVTTSQKPTLPTHLSSMASSDKRIPSTGRSTQMLARARQPTVYPGAQLAQSPGMGFGCMPPLPIILGPFKFLKKLNLTSVGLGLESVPFSFGWDLVAWTQKLMNLGLIWGKNWLMNL